ncbi:MAG: DmsE family decaheme c-type cytochrome [Terriglobia bacterium]
MKKLIVKFGSRLQLAGFVAVATLSSGLVMAQRQPAATEPSSVAWKAPVEGTAADYIGEETCAGCHADQARQFAKTVHAHAAVEGVNYGTGCESCHGPGKAHAEHQMEAGGDAAKLEAGKKLIYGFHGKPEENAARCLACHRTSRDQDLFNRSEHKLQGVSCDQCHSAHLLERTSKRERAVTSVAQSTFFSVPKLTEENRWLSQSLLRKTQPDLCFTCHRTIQAQFALPTHHRVPEGFIKCTDCHNAHGTLQRPLLKKSNWEACVACHAEKRGPFVFEHAAVKVEGCTICHTPHGSVTRNLLTRREDRFTCLECHVDPHAANVPHGRLGFQTRGECVRCHVMVHGSNVSEFFLQ